jgi:hypothetical protein
VQLASFYVVFDQFGNLS